MRKATQKGFSPSYGSNDDRNYLLTEIRFKPWLDLNFLYNYGDNVTFILYSHQTSGHFCKDANLMRQRGVKYISVVHTL